MEQIQRQRLHAAVLDVAAEEGYRATTVHKVLARAGISRRTFYELYDSLDDCYLAAYAETTEEAAREATAVCTRGEVDTPAARLEAGLTAVLELCASDPNAAKACVVEVLAAGPVARQRRADMLEGLSLLVAEQLRECDGTREPDTALVRARVLVGGVSELIFDRLLRDDAESLPGLVPSILALEVGRPPVAEAVGGR